MKSFFIVVIVSATIADAAAQPAFRPTVSPMLSLSTASLDFGTKQTNAKDSLSFRIRNSGTSSVSISDINTYKAAFTLRDTAFVIPSNDSATVWVYFQTNQNVRWSDVLVIENNGGRGSLTVRLTGMGTYNEPAYASTQNLWENALKTALTNLVLNHTNLGYNTARDRMFETLDDGGVDTIECVYTGRKVYATTRTAAQNQNFNTEHTWPQSFFNDAEPMRADINHLFPTDAPANSARANYPFGFVTSNVTWQVGGSRLGNRSTGETVFEARSVHRGDVARGVFYFVLRYGNLGNFLALNQETDLRAWYNADPVSPKEINRNNGVALPTNQGKRNPLIDHPEFVERITHFYSTAAPALHPNIVVSPSSVNFGNVLVNTTAGFDLIINNTGRATLDITSVTLSGSSDFFVASSPTSIPPDTFGVVRVQFTSLELSDVSLGTLSIASNDPDQPIVNVAVLGTRSIRISVLRVMLEGPYNAATSGMHRTLNTNGILASRYPGGGFSSTTVDSVNIEIRNAPTAAASTVREFRGAWLDSTGNIYSLEFTSPGGMYYVIVRHANHLPIMTSAAIPISTLPGGYDFTISQSSAYGTEPMKQVAPNVFAMYAGDANASEVVSASDANAVFGVLNFAGYSLMDVNLSGIVSAADANMIFGNLNRGSHVP
jgi:endonuclease I